MSRPAAVVKRISKNISLPEDLVVRMELELYSEVDQRIPIGAQSQLIEALLRQHFTRQDNVQAERDKKLADPTTFYPTEEP